MQLCKVNIIIDKTGYIKKKYTLLMNLKERGITIGDLLIIIIIILTTTTVVKTFNNEKESTFNQINQNKMPFERILV